MTKTIINNFNCDGKHELLKNKFTEQKQKFTLNTFAKKKQQHKLKSTHNTTYLLKHRKICDICTKNMNYIIT